MAEANLKILLLAGRFEVRGSCAYTIRLVEHLHEFDIASEIVCSSAEMVPQAKREGLPVHVYRRLDLPLLNHFALHDLIQHYREEPPSLIHVQTRKVLDVGNQIAESLNVPYVLTMHDLLQPRERLRFSSRWGKKIIAVSDAVKADLVERAGVPDALVDVIPSGVDVNPLFRPAEPDADHVPVVGTAGPLEPIKGHWVFLQAAHEVLSRGIDVEFLIAGSGPEEDNLRRFARELGITEHVTFVPYVREYTEVLEAMDIFCLPSLQQGLGTVMLEAMALGKPVVASGVGGVYSVVHDGETGLLCPRRDWAALADRIVQLLADPKQARAMGENARRLVERQFSVDKMVAATARLYRKVLRSELVPAH